MKECNCHRGPEMGKKVIGCPPKVININHPQEPVLFHRVDVPAAMGDDTTYPPENGLYKNVLLVYEANNHIYLYNSDGIPTSLTVNTSEIEETLEDLGIRLAQETEDRLETDIALREDIDEVAEDLEEFKNSPDVVDIVATYAALQAYDTSSLTDKDVVRVLKDESRSGASSYYRWNESSSTWTFIGITGPYYTKSETDSRIGAIKGMARELTSEDYNWTTSSDTPCVALWLLDPGIYYNEEGVDIATHVNNGSTVVSLRPGLYIVTSADTTLDKEYKEIFRLQLSQYTGDAMQAYQVASTDGTLFASRKVLFENEIVDNLTSSSAIFPLSAKQGKILNERIGDLSTLTTTNKTSAVAAINEVKGNIPIITMQTTDPGEGVSLAANNFIAVYNV